MSPSKPAAPLRSGLLARKGEARPAMRPSQDRPALPADDQGWNDMGTDTGEEPLPAVLRQREALTDTWTAAEPEPERNAVSSAEISRIREELAGKDARAAFTLRLDADRHLRLRLAAAVRNCSAQQLVLEALDRLLETLPEVESLATSLPARRASR